MKFINVITLGTYCTDKATELSGTLTHWLYDLDGHIEYIFQPRGLDEEGQPVQTLRIIAERLNVQPGNYEKVKVPFEILGSTVRDKASGFEGMAVSFIRHINGCFHVVIQPKGLNPKNNAPIQRSEFDLRSCEGEMITQLAEAKLKRSRLKKPSPIKIKLD